MKYVVKIEELGISGKVVIIRIQEFVVLRYFFNGIIVIFSFIWEIFKFYWKIQDSLVFVYIKFFMIEYNKNYVDLGDNQQY